MSRRVDQIYESLRNAIIHLEMRPGSSIVEKAVCQRFETSRTPVREAIQRLADEGLVQIQPHAGTYVKLLSERDAEDGFLIRRALEIEGVRRAATRIAAPDLEALQTSVADMQSLVDAGQVANYLDVDDSFHRHIARVSGIGGLWRFVSLAKVHLDRLRQLSAPVPGHLERVTAQHQSIVDALAAGDPDRAELSMRVHLDSAFEVMLRLSADQSDLFEQVQ